MKINEFIVLFRDEIRSGLECKSAWGKQQVLMLVETAIADVLLKGSTQECDDEE